MKNQLFAMILLLIGTILTACQEEIRRPDIMLIPQPASLNNLEGVFQISSGTKILINSDSKEMHRVTADLSRHLEGMYEIKGSPITWWSHPREYCWNPPPPMAFFTAYKHWYK
jgi:hypothetical protein